MSEWKLTICSLSGLFSSCQVPENYLAPTVPDSWNTVSFHVGFEPQLKGKVVQTCGCNLPNWTKMANCNSWKRLFPDTLKVGRKTSTLHAVHLMNPIFFLLLARPPPAPEKKHLGCSLSRCLAMFTCHWATVCSGQ